MCLLFLIHLYQCSYNKYKDKQGYKHSETLIRTLNTKPEPLLLVIDMRLCILLFHFMLFNDNLISFQHVYTYLLPAVFPKQILYNTRSWSAIQTHA